MASFPLIGQSMLINALMADADTVLAEKLHICYGVNSWRSKLLTEAIAVGII